MPVRFLIADDLPAQQRLLANAVMFVGGESRFASNGHEVLTLARQESFDIVLLDLQMPELGGVLAASELLDEWRNLPHRPRVMAVSGEDPETARVLCRAVGMDGLVSKPYTMTDMKRSLMQLVTQGHCWKEGPALRLLDVKQLRRGMNGHDDSALNSAIDEARFQFLTLRTRLARLPTEEVAGLAGSLEAFAQKHGFVHMVPAMRHLAQQAADSGAGAHASSLVVQHDFFEIASKAALIWQRHPHLNGNT